MARPPKPALPLRQGVAASAVFCPPGGWASTTAFLQERLPRVEDWPERVARGDVVDDDGRPVPDAPYVGNRRVYYWRHLDVEPEVPFEARIVFQDEHLLVADKPHFLPVTPGGRFVKETLLVRLKRELDLPTLSPLHRLDRETAGVVAFCVRPQDRDAYQRLFRERQVHKVYEAVAPWHPGLTFPLTRSSHLREDPERFYRMHEVPADEAERLGLAPNSTTRVELLQHTAADASASASAPQALYRLHPISGKRHQLRVHMAALGLPIANDQFYPEVLKAPGEWEDFNTPPLQLLGRELAFTDPVTGEPRCFVSRQTLLIQ